VIKSL